MAGRQTRSHMLQKKLPRLSMMLKMIVMSLLLRAKGDMMQAINFSAYTSLTYTLVENLINFKMVYDRPY